MSGNNLPYTILVEAWTVERAEQTIHSLIPKGEITGISPLSVNGHFAVYVNVEVGPDAALMSAVEAALNKEMADGIIEWWSRAWPR